MKLVNLCQQITGGLGDWYYINYRIICMVQYESHISEVYKPWIGRGRGTCEVKNSIGKVLKCLIVMFRKLLLPRMCFVLQS